jgi:hypothetical protein
MSDDLGWYQRMAARAAARAAANPSPPPPHSPHADHHQHHDGNGIVCSCGDLLAVYTIIPIPPDHPDWVDPATLVCEICGQRGVTHAAEWRP